jgi:type I restriction enzyme M protein
MTRPLSHDSQALVQKLWNFCNLLRDDGLSYGDYVEQLTYLLFLKMAYERTEAPWSEESRIPGGYDWPSLVEKDGAGLEAHYTGLLNELGKQPGLLGLIFRKAQNKVQDPAKLRRLIVDLIGPETWLGVDADLKGDAYEDLLERNAADTKSGAGQYFTPRPLIQAIVDVMRPKPGMRIGDPACGTGGFLLIAHNYIVEHFADQMDRDDKHFLRDHAFWGAEIVDNTARLCAMNLFLHGIGGSTSDATPPVEVRDSLLTEPNEKFAMVLANPPFGKKSSATLIGAVGKTTNGDMSYSRPDFWATSSNKQLNFLQHIRSMLEIGGSAAVVLPDNVLFEGGAGETIRRRLLHECDVHTILRLPSGIFYAQGVKANVLFFERRAASAEPATQELWVYDFRTNLHFTLKTKQLTRADLDEFVEAYCADDRAKRQENERWKRWSHEQIAERSAFNLDIWADVQDESLEDAAGLPAPEVIAEEIVEYLTGALEQFAAIARELSGSGNGSTGARAVEQ